MKTVIMLIIPFILFKLNESIIPDDLITKPKAPPAPVIKRISNDFFNESKIHLGTSLELLLSTKKTEIRTPMIKAISGLPIKSIPYNKFLPIKSNKGYFNIVDKEISIIGIIMGKKIKIDFS